MPKAGLMLKIQSEITEKMRIMVIDWLIDIHFKFQLFPETLYLAVNIMDRYLAQVNILKSKLELVGVTVLFIACKYEEITPPEIKEFQYIGEKIYSKDEIVDMEGKILVALSIELSIISPLRFLERYGRLALFDDKNFFLAKYLLEIALMDYKMLRYPPSQIVCATIFLINKNLNKDPCWSDNLARSCKYSDLQLRSCLIDLFDSIQSATKSSSYQAIKKKYTLPKYGEVTKIVIDKY